MSEAQNQQQMDANKACFDRRFQGFMAMLDELPNLVNESEDEDECFNSWVKLELMGRKVLVGMATEVLIAGATMLRIDVLPAGKNPAYTQFFGASAIYCITPITEEAARRIAPNINSSPITQWELGQLPLDDENGSGDDDEDDWDTE